MCWMAGAVPLSMWLTINVFIEGTNHNLWASIWDAMGHSHAAIGYHVGQIMDGWMEWQIIINTVIILCFRTKSFKWLLSREEGQQMWSPNEAYSLLNLNGTSTTSTLSLESGSYTILPPIGKTPIGIDPDESLFQNEDAAYPIHRSSSNGYLSLMEKQKQLKNKVTYKVGVFVNGEMQYVLLSL